MNNQETTIDPLTGKVYRLTAPKVRSAQFRALQAAIQAAKEAQASYMHNNMLAFDATRGITVSLQTQEAPTDGAILTKIGELLTATKAAQLAAKAYRQAHPGEFQAQTSAKQGRIPVINPRGRGRGGPSRGGITRGG